MSIQIKTAHMEATDCSLITVEACMMRGFSGLQLIGSHTDVCKSGLERAKAALEAIGFKLPQRKVVLSMMPAELRKDGSQFDLAFALCVACLSNTQLKQEKLGSWLFLAELSLNGELRPVKGAISSALLAMSNGLEGLVVSHKNLDEITALLNLRQDGPLTLKVLAFKHLKDIIAWLQEEASAKLPLTISDNREKASGTFELKPNFDDMILSETMNKIALVIACGRHSLFLYGSPGSGKSMFCSRLPSIMPKMVAEDHIESLRIHSAFQANVCHKLMIGSPPLRAPHHQASSAAVLGVPECPGEVSLAHGGILFLDELPEFRRDLLEALREPLQVSYVTVSRARRKVTWKSRFVLLGASNNCPCGWFGSVRRRCICPTSKVLNYKRKISGPIIDRIDIHINMEEFMVDRSSLFVRSSSMNSKNDEKTQTQKLRNDVELALAFSNKRNEHLQVDYNCSLGSEQLHEASQLSSQSFQRMISAFGLTSISNRGIAKALKVARTLADLDQSKVIQEQHFRLALSWSHESCAKERGDEAYGLI